MVILFVVDCFILLRAENILVKICRSYCMVCACAREDNTRALASELLPVHMQNHTIHVTYLLHQHESLFALYCNNIERSNNTRRLSQSAGQGLNLRLGSNGDLNDVFTVYTLIRLWICA